MEGVKVSELAKGPPARFRKANEPARTRSNGTRVYKTATGAERIQACREIRAAGQYAKIDGQMVDTFSASAVCAVDVWLTERAAPEKRAEYREKFEKLSIGAMAKFAFALLK